MNRIRRWLFNRAVLKILKKNHYYAEIAVRKDLVPSLEKYLAKHRYRIHAQEIKEVPTYMKVTINFIPG